MMRKVFKYQIRRLLEVYTDDMILKKTSNVDYTVDLIKASVEVQIHNMRLDAEKCMSDVQTSKFLSFYLTEQGIEANPYKCRSIMEMRLPTT